MSNSIPKIIHYCWFGNPNKPKNVKRFIDSWKEQLPDFTFMEWNEKNCDLSQEIGYVKQAYRAQKYAFVSDYIRVKKLVEYGGVYLDTDVRIVKRFDKLLHKHDVVLGFEGTGKLGTAFMASIPRHPLFTEFLQTYSNRRFVRDDGSYDMTSINASIAPLFVKRGLNLNKSEYQHISENIAVYPTDYFCAFNMDDWYPEPTNRTYTIHFMASSWQSKKIKFKIALFYIMRKCLGDKNYNTFRRFLRKGN